MQFEHFIHGVFNGVGTRLVKSAGVDQILSRESLRTLCNIEGESRVQTWLPENIVAVTYLSSSTDEYGRATTWNHTILVNMRDYFKLNPPHMFESHFIRGLEKPPVTLEPLKVKTT